MSNRVMRYENWYSIRVYRLLLPSIIWFWSCSWTKSWFRVFWVSNKHSTDIILTILELLLPPRFIVCAYSWRLYCFYMAWSCSKPARKTLCPHQQFHLLPYHQYDQRQATICVLLWCQGVFKIIPCAWDSCCYVFWKLPKSCAEGVQVSVHGGALH